MNNICSGVRRCGTYTVGNDHLSLSTVWWGYWMNGFNLSACQICTIVKNQGKKLIGSGRKGNSNQWMANIQWKPLFRNTYVPNGCLFGEEIVRSLKEDGCQKLPEGVPSSWRLADVLGFYYPYLWAVWGRGNTTEFYILGL